MFRVFTTQDWIRFVEVYGQPIRIGRHAPDANDKDMRTLYRAVRKRSGVVAPARGSGEAIGAQPWPASSRGSNG